MTSGRNRMRSFPMCHPAAVYDSNSQRGSKRPGEDGGPTAVATLPTPRPRNRRRAPGPLERNAPRIARSSAYTKLPSPGCMVTTWCRRDAGERRTISHPHRSEPPPPNPSITCSTRTDCADLTGKISLQLERLLAASQTSRLLLADKVKSIGRNSEVGVPANRQIEILQGPHEEAKERLHQSLKVLTGHEIKEVLYKERRQKRGRPAAHAAIDLAKT